MRRMKKLCRNRKFRSVPAEFFDVRDISEYG